MKTFHNSLSCREKITYTAGGVITASAVGFMMLRRRVANPNQIKRLYFSSTCAIVSATIVNILNAIF